MLDGGEKLMGGALWWSAFWKAEDMLDGGEKLRAGAFWWFAFW